MDESTANSILSSRASLYSNAGGQSLSGFYPNAGNTTKHLAPASTSQGRQRINATSKGFNSTSTFYISSNDILSGWNLNLQVTLGIGGQADNRIATVHGWGFNLIESMELVLPSSFSAQQRISGEALFNYALLCCRSPEERFQMLESAGTVKTGLKTGDTDRLTASVPVSLGIFQINGNANGFGIDSSTISGPIQLIVRFRDLKACMSITAFNTDNVVLTTSTFDVCELTMRSSQLALNSASVRSLLSADQTQSYNLPTNYIVSQTVQTITGNNSTGITFDVNLTGAPNAMLNYILISVKPAFATTSAGTSAGIAEKRLYSDRVHALRLTYDSQVLFDARSMDELRRYMITAFGGDDLSYQVVSPLNAVVGGAQTLADTYHECQLLCIPLVFDGAKCRTREVLENLPSYGSALLQLTIEIGGTYERGVIKSRAGPVAVFGPANNSAGAIADQAYQVDVAYVCSSTLSISASGIEILL